MKYRNIGLLKVEELAEAVHPNNIEVGYDVTGAFVKEPKIGEAFWVGLGWRTSKVTEIISEDTFKTLNSTYRWRFLESNV